MSEGSENLNDSIPSKEPVQFPPRPAPSSTPADTVNLALSELSTLVRRAFEEKRHKNCLALTSAILKIDPNNKEALVIQSWVRADLEEELERVYMLVREAHARNSLVSYDRAERALRSFISLAPDNEKAKALLNEVLTSASGAPHFESGVPVTDDTPIDPVPNRFSVLARTNKLVIPAILVALIALAVVAGVIVFRTGRPEIASAGVESTPVGTLDIAMDDGVQVLVNDVYKGTTPLEPMNLEPGSYLLKYKLGGQIIGEEQVTVFAGRAANNHVTSTEGGLKFLLVPRTGVRMALDGGPVQPVPTYLRLKAGEHRMSFTADGYVPDSVTTAIRAGEDRNFPVTLQPSGTLRPATPAAASRAEATRPAPRPAPSAVAPASTETGTLALSAAIPVEIYAGQRLLGSTPTSVRLPAGTHTLEFRYGQFSKTESHVIRANQTTTATIGFDMTVQINARPYAQVFIDGPQMRPLGETPLGDVRVPVGSFLVFRHPNFPEKRYLVDGRETTIQVGFQ